MKFPSSRIAAIVLCAAVVCFGQTIKLASLAPAGSPYDNGLRSMAAEWEKVTGGAGKMIIYSGGVAGDEEDMLRKMKIGQLQAAGITAVGLCRLVRDIITMQLPMVMRTDEELLYVLDKMGPTFDKELEQKGVRVLTWMPVGWVHYFARQPIASPEQLKKMKMFFWAGDPHSVQAWKEMGFNPIPLAATDIMSSLQSGMVDAFAAPPLSAGPYQWFTVANNMCDLKWAPLVGAIVISTQAWNRIKPDLRPRLEEIVKNYGAVMNREVLRADREAVEAMKQNGLTVNPVTPEMEIEWKKLAELGLSKTEGKSFDPKYRVMVEKHVETFRQSRKTGQP
jgi:TRAP-type transport system periplasmic protein